MAQEEIEIIIDPKKQTTEWETHNISSDQKCDKMLEVFQRDNDVLGTETTHGEEMNMPDYDFIDED